MKFEFAGICRYSEEYSSSMIVAVATFPDGEYAAYGQEFKTTEPLTADQAQEFWDKAYQDCKDIYERRI